MIVNTTQEKLFIEVGHYQAFKYEQLVGGDNFLVHKLREEDRVISVLSDGLGSGIKASVLATLTATMAFKFIANYKNIRKTAEIIMQTLPICKIRKISYATFTIIDIDGDRRARIIEYDNPPFILARGNTIVDIKKKPVRINPSKYRDNVLQYSRFPLHLEDRIIFFSDGVSQSGMGTSDTPLGWGMDGVKKFIEEIISERGSISARELSKKVVQKACELDCLQPKDDITCGVIYLRKPRELLVITGPPILPEKDPYLGTIVKNFSGRKAICGGTTAKIVARELGREVKVNIKDLDSEVPPYSTMDGVDIITEGTITMGKVAEILENGFGAQQKKANAATKLANLLVNSDIIYFVVGTKINEAHQNPNIPVELEIRRNIVKKIIRLLEDKYVKETYVEFI